VLERVERQVLGHSAPGSIARTRGLSRARGLLYVPSSQAARTVGIDQRSATNVHVACNLQLAACNAFDFNRLTLLHIPATRPSPNCVLASRSVRFGTRTSGCTVLALVA
jgi:hypothetical protein